MGGQGSGGWNLKYEYTTSDLFRLDVNQLREQGYFDWPFQRQMTWSTNGIVQLDLKVRYERGMLHLRDATTLREPEADPFAQEIELASRTSAVGGETALFKCPRCHSVRAHLYLYHTVFICRECAGLTYRSRRERKSTRAFRKWTKLSKMLGGIKMDEWYSAPRPKGMHNRTFERLKIEISEIENDIHLEFGEPLKR